MQVRQILRCVAIKPPHSSRVTFCIDSTGGRCHEQISRLNLYSKLSTSRERIRKKRRKRKVAQDLTQISEFWTSDFWRKSNLPQNVWSAILVSSFDFNSLCKLSSLPRRWVSFGFLKRELIERNENLGFFIERRKIFFLSFDPFYLRRLFTVDW